MTMLQKTVLIPCIQGWLGCHCEEHGDEALVLSGVEAI